MYGNKKTDEKTKAKIMDQQEDSCLLRLDQLYMYSMDEIHPHLICFELDKLINETRRIDELSQEQFITERAEALKDFQQYPGTYHNIDTTGNLYVDVSEISDMMLWDYNLYNK